MDEVKDVLDGKELADMLGLCYNYVMTLARESKIPSVRIGDRVKFHREAVRDWLYFATLGGQKAAMEHMSMNFDEMMHWIMKFRAYRDVRETELVAAAKLALGELQGKYFADTKPDLEIINRLDVALKGVEIFNPLIDR